MAGDAQLPMRVHHRSPLGAVAGGVAVSENLGAMAATPGLVAWRNVMRAAPGPIQHKMSRLLMDPHGNYAGRGLDAAIVAAYLTQQTGKAHTAKDADRVRETLGIS